MSSHDNFNIDHSTNVYHLDKWRYVTIVLFLHKYFLIRVYRCIDICGIICPK